MKSILSVIFFCAMLMLSCGNSETQTATTFSTPELKDGPDSMIYGLSCDGSNDTVIILLPFGEGKDPVTYNIETAKRQGKIIGKPSIGDWVGIIVNPSDTTEATMVINLDQLKGTWTYQVTPTWKEASKMSRRALARKMAEMPDSLRHAYMIPREYGFTLKRSSMAAPVGYVMRTSSLEDDSPVEYPAVKHYTNWRCRNGQLILISSDINSVLKTSNSNSDKTELIYDTLDFISMTDDSLVMRNSLGNTIGFHRQINAMTANAAAQKAAQKVDTKVKK